jgi:hypothetical protein
MPANRTILLVFLFLLTIPALRTAQAQGPAGDLGLGGQIGDPSGITLKIYQRPTFAYELVAAWDLDDFFFLNGHALFERPIPDSPLRYYLGPGVVIGVQDDDTPRSRNDVVVGISGQAGVNFFVERFEVFLHLTPRLNVIPDTDGEIGGGIGLRYYF